MLIVLACAATAALVPTADRLTTQLSADGSGSSGQGLSLSQGQSTSELCDRKPPKASNSQTAISQKCGRCEVMTCLAEEDALLQAEPDKASQKCCEHVATFEKPLMRYPREHVELAKQLAEKTEKTVDFIFAGSMTTSGHRDWVRAFVQSHFTDSSWYVDTIPALWTTTPLSAYKSIGPFDHTVERVNGGAIQIRGDEGAGAYACGAARPDPAYLQDMARAKFALCPRGDHPWSIRFFEAIMSRAIPIVDDPEHTGRNPEERALGYHYLMREDVEKMMPDGPEYCESWAEENMRIFLEHQAYAGVFNTTI